jgi:hypothetical protein
MDKNMTDLAYRQGAGIEVTLLWHRTNGELTVSVTDVASSASFELPVSPDEALAAFHHPCAYAAVKKRPIRRTSEDNDGGRYKRARYAEHGIRARAAQSKPARPARRLRPRLCHGG